MTAKDLVQDAVHRPHFSGTHIARLALLLPWVLSAFMPILQQQYILYPISFSSPVALADTSMGTDFHLFTALVGLLALMWSQVLEARCRQKVPASKEVQTSRWASTLGGCTTKDAKSIKVWTSSKPRRDPQVVSMAVSYGFTHYGFTPFVSPLFPPCFHP